MPRIRVLDFLKNQQDEMISQFASIAGQQAATQFKPETERIIRYAQLAAWFGIAGFVVGLLALLGTIILAVIVVL